MASVVFGGIYIDLRRLNTGKVLLRTCRWDLMAVLSPFVFIDSGKMVEMLLLQTETWQHKGNISTIT